VAARRGGGTLAHSSSSLAAAAASSSLSQESWFCCAVDGCGKGALLPLPFCVLVVLLRRCGHRRAISCAFHCGRSFPLGDAFGSLPSRQRRNSSPGLSIISQQHRMRVPAKGGAGTGWTVTSYRGVNLYSAEGCCLAHIPLRHISALLPHLGVCGVCAHFVATCLNIIAHKNAWCRFHRLYSAPHGEKTNGVSLRHCTDARDLPCHWRGACHLSHHCRQLLSIWRWMGAIKRFRTALNDLLTHTPAPPACTHSTGALGGGSMVALWLSYYRTFVGCWLSWARLLALHLDCLHMNFLLTWRVISSNNKQNMVAENGIAPVDNFAGRRARTRICAVRRTFDYAGRSGVRGGREPCPARLLAGGA